MPVEGPLPQTGDQQDIGADADRCFRARIPNNWRPHSLDGTDDFGLDYQVQTTPGQRATDIFRVQLKGTRSPDLSTDGEFISIQLKASTVRFYDRLVEPILLVVCDLSVNPDPVDCPLYYIWIRDELRRILVSNLPPEQKYVTFRVPICNRLKHSTDLSADIDAQNELARAGHALSVNIEQTHPGMLIEERVCVVQQMTSGISSRSAAFIDALASPPEHHWIDPPQGSLAWHLRAAERFLKIGSLERASAELDTAEEMLTGATSLEIADYWFLRGRWQTGKGSDDEASKSFLQAFASNKLGKYLSAHVEAELRIRYTKDGPQSHSDLISLLSGNEPVVLSVKSRVLASEGKLKEAIEVADMINGPERNAARAIANIMFSQPEEALQDCESGLSLPNLPDNCRQLLLLMRARAKFSLAQASTSAPEGEMLPPSGVAGIDASLVKDAWDAIQEAVDVLREVGWGPNIEHLADIWAATASILGKQKMVLPELETAARLRPYFPNLQGALESIAAQCGDFTAALEANDRLPNSDTRILRRTLLLHEAQKHTDCFRWFDAHYDKLDRNNGLFGPAATVAAISAHKLSEPSLVKKWSAELESHPQLEEHAAILQYFIATELNKIGNDEAITSLVQRYEELDRPFSLAVTLLQELNPTDEKQSVLCVQVAQRVCQKVEPSSNMATHIGLALVTVKDWSGLLEWCNKFKTRVDAGPRMLAFEALALDRLGYTQDARELLEKILAGGMLDSLALNTYVTIMVRCGYVQEALDASEKIMEAATSKRQQMECIRLLFNLIQQSEPGSKRLLALATQMGRLAAPTSEVEEGIYLVMFVMATINENNIPTPGELAEYHRRTEAFFARFPESKILRRATFQDDASGQDIIAQLKEISGISEDREAFQRRLENQMQQGLMVVPFSWRPKIVLSSIHDVVHLWEVAKTSSIDDKKYHLTMHNDINWTPPAATSLRAHIPLLDLTTLLVLFDLNLIDTVVKFFGKVGIAKATLETLADLVNPISGSLLRSKCLALQNALKPHLSAIIQPSMLGLGNVEEDADGREAPVFGREHKEIAYLCHNSDDYYLYSDDLAFRLVAAKIDKPDGICTLDVLAGLEEVGFLTREEVASKLSMLCGWRVGVVILFEYQVALFPRDWDKVSNVKQGMEMLDQHPEFMTIITALWDFRSSFNKMLEHVSAVIRRLADETDLPNDALASLLGQWFVKSGLKNDAPPDALAILTKAITRAASLPTLSKTTSAKLWAVYKKLVEFHYGPYMDEQKERNAIRMLGAECANMDTIDVGLGIEVQSALSAGLIPGTSEEEDFMNGYSKVLMRVAMTQPQK